MDKNIINTGLVRQNKTRGEYRTMRAWLVPDVIEGLEGPSDIYVNNSFHASETPSCPRKGVIKFGVPVAREYSASSKLYTEIGKTIHDLVQGAFMYRNILLFAEYRVELPEVDMSGYVDAILIDPMSHKPFIVDIKTTGKIPTKPKVSYTYQLMAYSLMTGIPDAELLYVSRNVGYPTPKMKNYHVYSDARLQQAAMAVSIAYIAKENAELPKRLRNKNMCSYCDFHKDCWENGTYHNNGLSKDNMLEAEQLAQQLVDTMPERYEQTVEYMRIHSKNVLARTL